MSTSATPATLSSSQLTPDQLTVIVASISCLVFFVVILVLLTILYRKDPLCCKVRTYQESHQYSEAPPRYYSSRQTLVGSVYNDPMTPSEMTYGNPAQQTGHVFVIGQPSSYHIPSLDAPLPHLPSYESVRKKDRQRQIHMMIADRFGLNSQIQMESPPTYEESVCQSAVIPPVNFGSTDDVTGLVTPTQSSAPTHSGVRQSPPTCRDPNT